MFKAWMLRKHGSDVSAELTELADDDLPQGDVLIEVAHSTLNYKDALALTHRAPIVRQWPMVPGIDGAGTVLRSSHPRWKVGDQVIHNGWGVDETHWGCLAGRAQLKGDWLVPLPPAFTTRQAMAIGTAGYTAMLCVLALQRQGVQPGQGLGEVLVTGATGGVGSIAVALLARAGYAVAAATGKVDQGDYLRALGASTLIDRTELSAPGKPLQKERWAAVVDAVGSHSLANACAQTRYGGVVAACGLAQGPDFPATVMPFILRGVTLCGVDSVMAPLALREQAWSRLATDLDPDTLEKVTHEIGMSQVLEQAQALMTGQVTGRIVVDVER